VQGYNYLYKETEASSNGIFRTQKEKNKTRKIEIKVVKSSQK
jgi:hypothetical protein